jgi:hypothetical protein
MYGISARAIVSAYLPATLPNPAEVDAGRVVDLTWLLFIQLHSFMVSPDIEQQADFFAELLVAVEARIAGR